MPDNLYWTMAMPTSDPEILRERKEARERENLEYGKVLSNTGTEEEVRTYFRDRRRLSEDYVTFIGQVLDDYRDVIPDRDVRLLELAQSMHQTRLSELPRQLDEALERRAAHAARREAWLAAKTSAAEHPTDPPVPAQ